MSDKGYEPHINNTIFRRGASAAMSLSVNDFDINLSSTKMSQIFDLCEFNDTVVKPVLPSLLIEFQSCFIII